MKIDNHVKDVEKQIMVHRAVVLQKLGEVYSLERELVAMEKHLAILKELKDGLS